MTKVWIQNKCFESPIETARLYERMRGSDEYSAPAFYIWHVHLDSFSDDVYEMGAVRFDWCSFQHNEIVIVVRTIWQLEPEQELSKQMLFWFCSIQQCCNVSESRWICVFYNSIHSLAPAPNGHNTRENILYAYENVKEKNSWRFNQLCLYCHFFPLHLLQFTHTRSRPVHTRLRYYTLM